MKIMISIVIIVKNDKGIKDTLNKLLIIPKPTTCEIIVVDASNGYLDSIKDQFSEVRWIYYKNTSGKKITIPEQRNLGVKSASGKIIVFIDASCIPDNNWLVELYKTHKNNSKIVCGAVNKREHHDIWKEGENTLYKDEFYTLNLLLDKKVFDKIGYFDESLSMSEDIDLSWRAIEAGYTIKFNPNAVVYHDWGNYLDEIKRTYRYGKGRAMLYKKYPNKFLGMLKKDRVIMIYILYLLFLPLTIKFVFFPLFILLPVLINIYKKNYFNFYKPILVNLSYSLGIIKGVALNY